jgi:hypothetical protein
MNWKRLEAVIQSRYPGRAYTDIQNAVKQYVHFLQLKKDKKDYQSRYYAPSFLINEVWIAHLSFLDRYQSDIQIFTGLKSRIFDHNPITKDKLLDRYKMTRQAHIQRISGLSDEPVDIKFWSENGEDPDDKTNDDHQQHGDSEVVDLTETSPPRKKMKVNSDDKKNNASDVDVKEIKELCPINWNVELSDDGSPVSQEVNLSLSVVDGRSPIGKHSDLIKKCMKYIDPNNVRDSEDKFDTKTTVKELQSECRKRKIPFSGLRKFGLIEFLQSKMD